MRRGVVLAGAGALMMGAGATAALIAGDGDLTESRLARSALRASANTADCRSARNAVRFIPDAPQPETLEAFGLFRRPRASTDRLPRPLLSRGLPSGDGAVVETSIRRIRLPGAYDLYVFITRGPVLGASLPRDPAACGARRHAEVDRIGEQSDPAEVRAAHAAIDQFGRRERAQALDRDDQLALFYFSANGSGGGGGASVAKAKARGLGGWSLQRRANHRLRLLHGLVPDPVAMIEARMTFRGRPFRRTVRVHDNVYAFTVPYGGYVRLIWRDRDGRHIARGEHP
jgi:hypothetical protein